MCLEQDAEFGSRRDALRHGADLLEDSDPDVHILIMAGQKYYINSAANQNKNSYGNSEKRGLFTSNSSEALHSSESKRVK
jgi:hypothetical protein